MAKENDININVKTPGIENANTGIDKTTDSIQKLGQTAATAGKQTQAAGESGAEGMESLSRRSGDAKSSMDGLASGVKSAIAAMAGFNAVLEIFQSLSAEMQKIVDLQSKIHSDAMSSLKIGQSLEMQTGTVGKQDYWAEYAAKLQAAGGFSNIAITGQMAQAFDVATTASGGIKNESNQNLLMDIAPMFGASQMSGEEIAKFFEYTGTMGVKQSKQGYQAAFAKIMSGYRASKTTQGIGAYITGLQAGTTGMISQGISPENAMALFTAARSVMPNEAVAATLTEQLARMSSGAYEEPRKAMEAFAGKSWGEMTPDQQLATMLNYAQSIDSDKRLQTLTEQGFSPELATGLSKITSAQGMGVYKSTLNTLRSTSPDNLLDQVDAFSGSPLGKSGSRGGKKSQDDLNIDKKIRSFQDRLESARNTLKNLNAEGKGAFLVDDKYEEYWIAYEQMSDELRSELSSLEGDSSVEAKGKRKKIENLLMRMGRSQQILGVPDTGIPGLKSLQAFEKTRETTYANEYANELNQVVYNYSNNTYFNQQPGQASERSSGGID
ncbi:MAG TPA: hypothetical protein PKB02_11525 [Anaerohalosphaeraceae bacterium]|nr:hypothetical protein [Anaerohalosphaeraceae bacterium]